MRLACGCATHTYGLDISKPDLNFKAECLKVQAELERRAAAYDVMLTHLNEPFYPDTQVTNCVAHSGLDITRRPRTCDLCRTDLENEYRYAVRVNEFLNAKLEKALAAAEPVSKTQSAVEGKEP